MHLLRGVAAVERHVRAAVDDEVVPENEGHRVAASGGRADRACAQLKSINQFISFCYFSGGAFGL